MTPRPHPATPRSTLAQYAPPSPRHTCRPVPHGGAPRPPGRRRGGGRRPPGGGGGAGGGGSPATGGGGRARGDGRGAFGRGIPSDRPIPVEIEPVRRGTVSRTATIAGILEPVRTVGVNAQLAGILLSVRAEEGTRVRRGQLLAEVDIRELQAQERSAEASLRLAAANFRRGEQLSRAKIIGPVDYARVRAPPESAGATLDGIRTRL